MSPIGRIFSVLNLLLAALFLSWAAMALSTADSFKQQLEEESRLRTADVERLEGEKAAAETARSEAAALADRLNNQLATMTNDRDRLRGEVEELERQHGEVRTTMERLSNSVDTANSSRDEATSAHLAAVEAKNTAEQEASDALAAKEAAETSAADLRAEIASLKSQLADKNANVVALRDELSQKETELQTIIDVTGVDAASIVGMPLINGVVIEALYDVEPGLVAINKGSADNVKRGFTFDIYSGADYKGRVRVENVRENTCTAIVTQPVDGKRIGQGDKAATRL